LGAPVFLAGINVGKVEGIRFPKALEEKEVVVSVRIQKKFQDRIRDDSTASIVTQGLLGDKAIFLTVGSVDRDELENGEEILVKKTFSFESFGEKGGELMDNVNKLAKNVNDVIQDVKTKDSLLHALVYDPEGQKVIKNLSGMVDSAKQIITEIQKGDGVLHALIYDKTRRNVGEDIGKAVENFKGLSENLKKVSAKIEQGEGSVGGLVNDPTVYYDLMTLLGNANRNKLLRTVIRATLATNEKDLIGE
jgi:phospholipid/cholesterol/gamma-HCH transport system substrate-binding protein